MGIPFNDFKRQYAAIGAEVDAALRETLSSGNYILGKKVKAFEEAFAQYLGAKYCVGVASGTDAITLSLMALGIKPGDEVITTAMTAFPTITGIIRAGAVPVLADIDGGDGLIDCAEIERRITGKTKAIVPVHLYGQSADLGKIAALAKARDLIIVEDCAQSTGAKFRDALTGTLGACGAFSFYPTKNLGAYGDGGAIAVNDRAVRDRLLSLRVYGRSEGYDHCAEGLNSRLDELQAAVLLVKLRHLDASNERRMEIARYYRKNIKTVECLAENDYGRPSYHLFVVKSGHREDLARHLKMKGISTLVHYPSAMSQQQILRERFGESRVCGFKKAEEFANRILSLPLYPELTDAEVECIARAVNEFK